MDPRRRFRFLKELSEGAFGKVYMAEMITGDNFRSIVAIKLLHGKWLGHEEIVQRSRDEARVLGLLHHRNIIRVEDLTSINGQCAVVMEYLDGVDIKTLVNYCKERTSRVPFKVAFEVIAAVASALEAAYNQTPLQGGEPLHLIHRDIKPSNVMITKAGDVKVLDFGTAQAKFDEREAHTQALAFGSAAYMAPERLLGDPDAPSGDVFSLGVTLYEMLAQSTFGKVHIRPEKYDRELDKRLAGIDLSELGPERETQVRQVMQLMLAYEHDDRPTARQVVDLMEALADEVHDGSMRRFARNVVSPCREILEPQPNPDDPLTGSTLFEDRTSGGRTLASLAESGEVPEEDESTWVEDGPPSPFQVPRELAGADTPANLIDDEFDDEFEDELDDHSDTPQPGRPAPTMSPLDEQDAGGVAGDGQPDPFVGMDSIAGAPSIGDVQPRSQNLASPPAAADPALPPAAPAAQAGTPGPDLPPEPGLGPAVEPAPPPAVARAAVPRTITPEQAPPAKSGGGGKLVIGLVALVVIGVIVMGGGFFAATRMGIIGGGASPDDPTTAVDAGAGVPGGQIEVAALDGTNGTLSLALLPPGSGSVSISSGTGFKQDWDGSGRLELIGLAPGTYKTKVKPAAGSAFRGTLEVQAGKTCSYVFPTTQDDAEWTADGCN